MDDDEFGEMNYFIDAWFFERPLGVGPIETVRIRAMADQAGVSHIQRRNVKELLERYSALWPQIEAALKNRIRPDQMLLPSYEVDPDILGGLDVMLNDEHLDFTVESRIQEYQEKLSNAQ